MADNVFKKYRARIAREGILKSILLSACIGLGALALTVLMSWIFGYKPGLYIGLGIFAAATAAFAPIFYFKLYRPTAKAVARRVDELGLEERVLTMVELENDPSYIAARQREDTLGALGTVDHMLVKVTVSAALMLTFVAALVLGTSSMTVGALYAADVIPSGVSLAKKDVLPNTYTLSYSVSGGGGGSIVMYTDDWTQEKSVSEEIIVTEGEDAPAVLAVGEENYIFIGWSDGVTEAYRQDLAVKSNLKVEAVFLKIAETVDSPEEEKFSAPDIYREPSDNENSDSDPDAPPWQQSPSENGENSDPQNQGNGPGGQVQNSENNQIIDGQTFYGDTYEDAHNSAMDRLGSDDSMSNDLKDSISQYYDSIEQNSSQDGEDGGEGESEGEN